MSVHPHLASLEELLSSASTVKTDVPLAKRTTLRLGGSAEVLVTLGSVEDVQRVLPWLQAHGLPTRVLGAGSNLLVSDEGVSGVLLTMGGGLKSFDLLDAVDPETRKARQWPEDAQVLRVGAAARNAYTVRTLHRSGLVGPEFLALIPGMIGGAVAMNAGTRWGDLKQALICVELVLPDGSLAMRTPEELEMGYRHCAIPAGALVVAAHLAVWPGDAGLAKDRVRDEKAYRNKTQPYSMACAGSFFANPPGDAAGRLIQAAGLKGLTFGGASISSMHANFIVNEGDGSAREVLTLMALARRRVRELFGVSLRPEVRLLGFGGGSAAEILDNLDIPDELLEMKA